MNNRPVKDILKSLVFDKNGVLYDEGVDITIEAMGKSHAVFFAILSAVAAGKTKYNEILSASGTAPGSMDKYLNQLTSDFNYLKRKTPVFGKIENSRISRYGFEDNFLSFWFRFVYRNRSMLEIGGGGRLAQSIDNELRSWQGPVWERTVTDLLIELNNRQTFEFPFTRIGAHFSQAGAADIDIVMVDDRGKYCAAGECKLNLNSCNIPSLIAAVRANAAALPLPVKKIFLFSVEPVTAATREYLQASQDTVAYGLNEIVALRK
jgi:hypothetical protein